MIRLILLLVVVGINYPAQIVYASVQDCSAECQTAFSKLERFARNGSPHAQTLVALTYHSGLIADEQGKRAWQWMNIARTQGFPPAFYHTSHWYRDGFKTTTDEDRAEEYLQRAAELAYLPAIFESGIHSLNRGMSQQGMQLVNKAAEKGHNGAKRLLARFQELNINTASITLDDTAVGEILGHLQGNNLFSSSHADSTPTALFNRVNEAVASQGIYNTKGTTGSHVSNVKCGEPGSVCRILRVDDDTDGWLLNEDTQ